MEIVAERLLLTIKLTLAGICRAVLLELPLGVSSLYFQRKTTGEAVLTDFPQVQIEPLENEAIESFLLMGYLVDSSSHYILGVGVPALVASTIVL